MKYKIFSKLIGLKNTKEIIELETEHEIIDFCIKDKNNIFFIHGNYIGLISNGQVNYAWSGHKEGHKETNIVYGTLETSEYFNPTSMFYMPKENSLYIVEASGSIIRKIEIGSNFTIPVFEGENLNLMKRIFVKLPTNSKTSIFVTNRLEIYWTSVLANRCFKYYNGIISTVIGTGRAGYTIFNSPDKSLVCFLDGVYVDNNTVYIADSGNNCIRTIDVNTGANLKTIMQNLYNPRIIKNVENKILYLDKHSVKIISNDKKMENINIYEGSYIVDIEGLNKELYILEKIIG